MSKEALTKQQCIRYQDDPDAPGCCVGCGDAREAHPVMPAEMCKKHLWLLVHQAGYKESDPWRALAIVAQIVLYQAATCDPKTHERIGEHLHNITSLGCLACYKPDAFGEVVEAAKSRDLKKIKALGERWVQEAARPST